MEPEPTWGSKNLNNKPEEYSSSTEREARSIALEKAYVHDVYQQIASHFSDSRYRAWPKVKQFLLELEPGSIVCDVGCGNGKYLDINPSIYKIGVDRCSNLTGAAREKNHEVLISDNLNIPFRDDCFDAVVSIAVIHHFATTERRVAALKELARVLRIGGRLMVSVWAMEQRHRRFESQDVLVPWSRPMTSSSDDKTSSIERDLNSTTTTTSDDDATHYHAYTQTSDSDHSYPSCSVGCRKVRHRGRSIDPTCPSSSQSSSDLSSPNESCYSFVRRALQKLAGTRRNRGRRYPANITGFLGLDIPVDDNGDHTGSMDEDAGDGLEFRNNMGMQPADNFMPIELRQLESTDFVELFQLKNEGRHRQRGMLFSDVLYPRRRRTLETTSEIQQSSGSMVAQPKSKSLSDLFGLIPAGILRSQRKSTDEVDKEKCVHVDEGIDVVRSTSSLSGLLSSNDEIQFPDCVRHKAVQTESVESLESGKEKPFGAARPSSEIIGNFLNNSQFLVGPNSGSTPNLTLEFVETNGKKLRPVLVKQKQSISHTSPEETAIETADQGPSETGSGDNAVCWGEIKKSVRDLPELRPPNTLQVPTSGRAGVALGSTFWKQSSLNEELIYSERLKEKEKLKQNIQKQCSLNEELIYKRRENTRWDQMKEAFLNSSNVKCLQLIKNGISNRFRGTEPTGQFDASSGSTQSQSPTFQRQSSNQTSSIRNGIVRMLQNWKQGEDTGSSPPPHGNFLGARRGSKESTVRRGLFPPFFLRRSSAGSLNLNKGKDFGDSSSKILSPPNLKRRPSENEIFHDNMGGSSGNKLIPGVRHVRKLSREEGSDSSKDSSFQSDTSVDSEDSFASVIFIPKAASMEAGNEGFVFNTETRANSTDSDRSPKSPGNRLSPPNHNLPKSPSPLASEILRRRSPEVSPTKINLYGTVGQKEVTKFIFDETTTNVLSCGPETISSKREREELPPSSVLSSVTVSVLEPQKEKPSGHEIRDIHVPVPVSQKKKVERIEVLRKPGVIPKGNKVTRQLVRRSLPKALAVELYNPETEDADTSDTSSSSPNSVSSVVSVVNEDNWPPTIPNHQPEKLLLKETADIIPETIEEVPELAEDKPEVKCLEGPAPTSSKSTSSPDEKAIPEPQIPKAKQTYDVQTPKASTVIKEQPQRSKSSDSQKSSSASILEAASSVVSSFESLVSQSSPKARRKLTLAKLGSTSDWLSSLPSDVSTSTSQHHTAHPLVKRSSMERRSAGEKLLLGDVKKYQPKGPDAKWPSSIMDDSPTQANKISEDSGDPTGSLNLNSQATAELSAKLLEEMEERDSLFDSLENLSSSRQHPSRNPSIDSSVRMSSTCSCSIRGGESFESWSSAKSSLTNSSSNQQKPPLPSIIPLPPLHSAKGGVAGPGASGRGRHLGASKSSSQAGEDTENSAGENSTALTYHRYYHVFREGELDKLIEKYVQNLHIISSYYDHTSWCIVAEKVQVWTI